MSIKGNGSFSVVGVRGIPLHLEPLFLRWQISWSISIETRAFVFGIKGYCSALNQVFASKRMELSSSQEISKLIKSFVKFCTLRKVRPPKWDIFLILCSLRRHLFEPLKKTSDRDLTLKALFLLALTLAKRVSELHGLSVQVHHSKG